MKLLNTLFEITIYSAVLFAAVTGFKLAFKNKLSPALHFTLWFLVIARLCIPVTIESGFHLFTVEQEKPLVQQQIPEASTFDAPTPAATREAAPSEALRSEAPAPVQEPLPAADSPKPVFTIASADALIALWVAGMAFRAAALLFGERRLRLAMAHNTLPTDARTRDIYDACCAELGIAHKLPLQSMAGIYSPALTVSLKPMILLPANITDTLSEAQLAYALRHELMHYRRRDHLLALLLLLLTCVYWFNPVVWLMKRELMKDMETACDSAVTARLNGAERREYAMTLLALFSQPYRVNSVLGMALSSAEKDAERRVRGLFLARRSKAAIKALAASLASLLLLCCFTTACQPTPEENIVVGKGNTSQDISAIETAPFAPIHSFNAPDTIKCEWDCRGTLVSIDAVTHVPNVDSYPIYSVSSTPYTQQQIDGFIRYFSNDNTLYDANRVAYTADELMEMLLWEQRLLSEVKSGKNTTFCGSIEQIEQNIQDLQNQLANAASQCPVEISPSEYTNSKNLSAYFLQNGERNYIIASCDNAVFARYYHAPFVSSTTLADLDELSISISRSDAEKLAYACVSDLGYPNMEISCSSRGEALVSEGQLGSGNNEQAYIFFFTRVVDGIPLTYEKRDRTSYGSSSNPAFSAPREYEFIKVAVSNNGIEEVLVNGNLTLSDKITENAPLMGFDEIKERAEEYFFLRYQSVNQSDSNTTDKRIIYIDRINLGYMQITAQNSSKQTLIPVWDFFGWEEIVNAETINQVTINGQTSYLTINAIDGSIIDRGLGY